MLYDYNKFDFILMTLCIIIGNDTYVAISGCEDYSLLKNCFAPALPTAF